MRTSFCRNRSPEESRKTTKSSVAPSVPPTPESVSAAQAMIPGWASTTFCGAPGSLVPSAISWTCSLASTRRESAPVPPKRSRSCSMICGASASIFDVGSARRSESPAGAGADADHHQDRRGHRRNAAAAERADERHEGEGGQEREDQRQEEAAGVVKHPGKQDDEGADDRDIDDARHDDRGRAGRFSVSTMTGSLAMGMSPSDDLAGVSAGKAAARAGSR